MCADVLLRAWTFHRFAGGLVASIFLFSALPYHLSHWTLGSAWPAFKKYQMSRLPQEPDTPKILKLAAQIVNPMLLEVPADLAAPPLTSLGEVTRYLRKHARPGEKIVTLCDQEIIQFQTSLITVYLVDPRLPTYSKVAHLPSYVGSYHDADWILLRNYWKRNYGMMELGEIDQNKEILDYFQKSGARLEPVPLRVREWFPVQTPSLAGHIWSTDFGGPAMQLYRVHRS